MERPMLFNTEMVRAILDGRKTQTRRIVKNQSLTEEQLKNCGKPCYPGDILWVRETWTVWSRTLGKMPAFHYKADGEDLANVKWHPSIHMPKEAARIWLKVTNVKCERLQDISFADIQAEGMDMDEWYEYDEWQHSVGDGMGDEIPVIFENPYHFFGSRVWDSTMGSLEKYEKYGWDANPWVWVIEFERIEEKQLLSIADRDSARYGDQGVLMPTT